MIAAADTVLILLAAGRSRRMGDMGSKLTQQFLARPLGLHVAVALEDVPFLRRCAVVAPDSGLDYAAHGFDVAVNDDPVRDLSSSVRAGMRAAEGCGARAVLIALADMPRVTAAHVWRMLDTADGAESVVASSDGEKPSPPALFGAAHFAKLSALTGDEGARDLIRAGRHVVTNAAELIDVDTPEDLERLRALVGVAAAGG